MVIYDIAPRLERLNTTIYENIYVNIKGERDKFRVDFYVRKGTYLLTKAVEDTTIPNEVCYKEWRRYQQNVTELIKRYEEVLLKEGKKVL